MFALFIPWLLLALVPTVAPPPLAPPPVIVTPAPIDSSPPAPELFERAVKPRAVQPLVRLFSTEDYPAEAARQGREGLVEAALTIGEDGRVVACSILRSSGTPSLDYGTCRILRSRARFEPARDADGRAVRSAEKARILWRLPPRPPVPLVPWHSLVTFVIGADNQLSGCTEERSPLAPVASNSCATEGTARVARLLAWRERKGGDEVTIRSFARLVPAGARPSTELPGGKRLGDLAADLTVGADGSVIECAMVRTVVPGPAIAPPDCRRMFRGPYRLASGSAVPAKARIEVLLLATP